MRIIKPAILALSLLGVLAVPLHAAPSSACKRCQEQRKACMTNYPGKTCQVEYDICIKDCRR